MVCGCRSSAKFLRSYQYRPTLGLVWKETNWVITIVCCVMQFLCCMYKTMFFLMNFTYNIAYIGHMNMSINHGSGQQMP